jgi:hypothetical protein
VSAERLRSDCEAIAKRLRSDCEVSAERLRSDCEAIVTPMRFTMLLPSCHLRFLLAASRFIRLAFSQSRPCFAHCIAVRPRKLRNRSSNSQSLSQSQNQPPPPSQIQSSPSPPQISAYETLYESSIAYGVRKALVAEQSKLDLAARKKGLEVANTDLRDQVCLRVWVA